MVKIDDMRSLRLRISRSIYSEFFGVEPEVRLRMSEQNRRAEAWTVVIAQYSHHRYRRKPFPLRLEALSPLFCHHQRCGQLHPPRFSVGFWFVIVTLLMRFAYFSFIVIAICYRGSSSSSSICSSISFGSEPSGLSANRPTPSPGPRLTRSPITQQ